MSLSHWFKLVGFVGNRIRVTYVHVAIRTYQDFIQDMMIVVWLLVLESDCQSNMIKPHTH